MLCGLLCCGLMPRMAEAQSTPNPPASTPANTVSLPLPPVTARRIRDAESAYLAGAKALSEDHVVQAEQHFAQALELNPGRTEYVLALADAKEHHLTELVQQAARARLAGNEDEAARLLASAKTIDPDNAIFAEHAVFQRAVGEPSGVEPTRRPPALEGAPQLDPLASRHDFDQSSDAKTLLRSIYQAYGIHVTFDDSLKDKQAHFVMQQASFADATRTALLMFHAFAVTVDPHTVLIAGDTLESRDRLEPLVEETLYIPGETPDRLTELGTVIRTIYNPRVITIGASSGTVVVRASEDNMRAINATLAELIDGGSDVLFDVHLFELDKSFERHIGADVPTSINAFSFAQVAQSILSANQAAISELTSLGYINANTSPLAILAILIKSGLVSAPQFTSLLAYFGGGLTIAGLYLGSNFNVDALLTASDARSIDYVTVRSSDGQPATFRTGTRYPIETSTYSGGVSSGLASSLAGLNINGTSVASLLSQYLGGAGSALTIPQVQYEDLGITLKLTPNIERSGEVHVKLDLKIEALAGGTINNIPILNNRTLTQDVVLPEGQQALLISDVNNQELRAAAGIPFLSEIPGFQGTDKDLQKNSGELLITITPHIVRSRGMQIASRRILVQNGASGGAQ
jgi:general secretion pathway protein D